MANRQPATYREWEPPAMLRPWLRCVWLRDTGEGRRETVRVLPDACADLMWIDGKLQVAGPDTSVHPAHRPPGGRVVGVRFHPGMVAPILGVNTADLTDLRVDLGDLWGSRGARLHERLGEASTVAAVVDGLLRTVGASVAADRPDPIVQGVVRTCTDLRGPLAVRELAGALGVSERQLRRRSRAAFGYGPRTLDRIVRFQRFLRLAGESPADPLALVAAEAGYADQAHLSRECQRLSGRPPAVLLAELTG